MVNWIDTDRTSPQDGKTVVIPPRLTNLVRIGDGPLVFPTRMGCQYIGSPMRSIGPQELRGAQPLETFINIIYAKHRDPAPTWSKVISHKVSDESRSDVYLRCWMNLTHDAVFSESPNFVNLGLSSVHTLDELGSIFIPTTRIGRMADGYNWLTPVHCIGEATADRVIRTRSEQNYNTKTDFGTRRENQDFGCQNNSMSRPPLDSTPLGKNTNNGTTSTLDLIPVRTKMQDPTPLTLPT